MHVTVKQTQGHLEHHVFEGEVEGTRAAQKERIRPLHYDTLIASLTPSTDTDVPLTCRSGCGVPHQPLSSALRDTVISLTRDSHEIPSVSRQQPLSCWVCLDRAVQSCVRSPAISWGQATLTDTEAEQAQQQQA